MGFQGQLNSVNLTDIFQTLNMNRQTGTLSVSGPAGMQHVWFEGGQIALCTAPPADGRPFLIHALLHKGLITAGQADDLAARVASTSQPLRDLILASGLVAEPDLDEVSAWCIEEAVCPIFEWRSGDFTFNDGPPNAEVQAPDAIAMGANRLQTTSLVLEATRRDDEWKRIREVVTDPDAFYIVDNEGRANLRNVESDPEMLKVLRYLDGRHTIESISEAVGVSRFDTFAIIAQLALANIARPRTPQEAIEDALALRAEGDNRKARELLENTLRQHNVPEVLRPLAEVCVELNQVPRAVELYLELIQRAQDAGDPGSALADLDTVIGLSPADPDLHFDRGQVLADLGQGEAAAAAFVQAAQAYLATRDVSQAMDACHRAKNLLPRASEPHRYLAKAYLIDGQTENAVIEYKSLWHALLSHERPRKALDELRSILAADCKFGVVKDQVLNHAQSSEAVKTGNAVRLLVYAAMVVVVGIGAWLGWEIIESKVLKTDALEQLEQIKRDKPADLAALRHAQVIDRLQDLARDNSSFSDVTERIDAVMREVKEDGDRRAATELQTAKSLLGRGRIEEAGRMFVAIRTAFPGSPAASEAEAGLNDVRLQDDERRWSAVVSEADALWDSQDWDEALAKLRELLARKDLPVQLRKSLAEKLAGWDLKTRSAQDLFRRAERLELLGRKRDAQAGFKRAMNGEGDSFRVKARERLLGLERALADDLGRRLEESFARGDDVAAFTTLASLRALAKDSVTSEADGLLAKLTLPFSVSLDSRHAYLVVKRKGQPDEVRRAPPGTAAGWVDRVRYPIDASLAIEVRRAGFATQNLVVNAEGRRSQAVVPLKRGSLWQADLNAAPTTTPIATGKHLLVGTNRSTLEIVDPGLGSSRPVVFDSVSAVPAAPYVFQGRAYLVLDDRLAVVDIDTRTQVWAWPGSELHDQTQLTPGTLWVQEHELIQGRTQVFAGSTSGRLLTLGIAGDQVSVSKPFQLESPFTGAPLVDRIGNASTLYVPAGPAVYAFDATSASERSAPRLLYTVATRGDVVGQPVRALVAGRPAILACDTSGVVIAIDADIKAVRKTIGSWSLEGTPTHGVTVRPGEKVGYVATTEGRVLFLDLANPGQLLQRYPAQGALAGVPGAPVIGVNGIYIADGNGVLYCVDKVSGVELWRCDVGGQIGTGILAHGGRLYVPTRANGEGGMLQCFEEGEKD
jgi:tetratricopeptide (TPR) repeat protein/outer membrane protein assembly factor BamB